MKNKKVIFLSRKPYESIKFSTGWVLRYTKQHPEYNIMWSSCHDAKICEMYIDYLLGKLKRNNIKIDISKTFRNICIKYNNRIRRYPWMAFANITNEMKTDPLYRGKK